MFFNSTYFYSNNLTRHTYLIRYNWDKKIRNSFLSEQNALHISLVFSKQRRLGEVNKERVILRVLITVNAELALR